MWLIPSNRPITWRRWTVYLIARLCLAAFTVLVLEAASEISSSGLRYLALLPTIGALLIPYGRPVQRRNPIEGTGAASVCAALVAVVAWPWYFYATATNEQTPAAIISTQTFSVDPGPSQDGSCLVLIDDKQKRWYTAHSLIDSARSNRVTIYQTAFGWTPDSHPMQSVSAFLRVPRLVQFAYTIAPFTSESCLQFQPTGR